MQDQFRLFLAVGVCILIFIAWHYFFSPPVDEKAQHAATQTKTQSTEIPTPEPDKPLVSPLAPAVPEQAEPQASKTLKVVTPLYEAEFSSNGGILSRFDLTGYRKAQAEGSPLMDFVSKQAFAKAPLGILLSGAPTWSRGAWEVKGDSMNLSAGSSGELIFICRTDELNMERKFTFHADSYLIDEQVTLTSNASIPVSTNITFRVASSNLSDEETSGSSINMNKVSYLDKKGLEELTDPGDLRNSVKVDHAVNFGAITSSYFMMAVAPAGQAAQLEARLENDVYIVEVEKLGLVLNPKTPFSLSTNYYLGPLGDQFLENAPAGLSKAVDYGWFSFISRPLLWVLRLMHDLCSNWGVAIIMLTILIKILFWPLSQKSYKSMENMKKIQPHMTALREKYKNDKTKLNEEMMRLYKTYKINPFGGCLPILVQLPVFIGLYQALMYSIELRHASFIPYIPFTDIPWLADLSAKDPYYITPIVMGATMFLQQKMSPAPGDPIQAKVMMFLPLIFTVMFLSFPSGLVVYWLVNNVLSIAQQWHMMRSTESAKQKLTKVKEKS